MVKVWPLGVLLFLAVLFFNFWMWDSDVLVLGLPVNLVYHIWVCVLASVLMWVIVRMAWPDALDEEADE